MAKFIVAIALFALVAVAFAQQDQAEASTKTGDLKTAESFYGGYYGYPYGGYGHGFYGGYGGYGYGYPYGGYGYGFYGR